ncbi:MAG: hypothetical protein ACMUJM_14060 [bacterium]
MYALHSRSVKYHINAKDAITDKELTHFAYLYGPSPKLHVFSYNEITPPIYEPLFLAVAEIVGSVENSPKVIYVGIRNQEFSKQLGISPQELRLVPIAVRWTYPQLRHYPQF